MPANIEIKARARDFKRQQGIAASLATEPAEVFNQVDTFFNVPIGRLKLRELQPDRGQLIHYLRDDIAGPKESTYSITATHEPAKLRALLTAALGVCGEVRKRRTVYHVGQTRIHFDDVERLGMFLELEVVLQAEQVREEGMAIARSLMRQLDVAESDLIDRAYIDLLYPIAGP
jgi:predicted adenylyl cyclase CyaB